MQSQPSPKVLMLLTSDFVRSRYEALRARAPDLHVVTDIEGASDPEVTALFAFKLPAGVRVTRAVEPGLGFSMAQFVSLQILRHFRSLPAMEHQHAASEWKRLAVPDASQVTVGIMGLGSIGSVVADALVALGFRVIAWTRTSGRKARVPVFVGESQKDEFLA